MDVGQEAICIKIDAHAVKNLQGRCASGVAWSSRPLGRVLPVVPCRIDDFHDWGPTPMDWPCCESRALREFPQRCVRRKVLLTHGEPESSDVLKPIEIAELVRACGSTGFTLQPVQLAIEEGESALQEFEIEIDNHNKLPEARSGRLTLPLS